MYEHILQHSEEAKLLWLAQAIDIEGCITIAAVHNQNTNKIDLVPHVQVTQKNRERCECLFAIAKTGYVTGPNPYTGMCIFGATHASAIELLTKVFPILTIKKEAANILLEWNHYRKSRPYNEPYTKVDYFIRQRKLHRRPLRGKGIQLFCKQLGIDFETIRQEVVT